MWLLKITHCKSHVFHMSTTCVFTTCGSHVKCCSNFTRDSHVGFFMWFFRKGMHGLLNYQAFIFPGFPNLKVTTFTLIMNISKICRGSQGLRWQTFLMTCLLIFLKKLEKSKHWNFRVVTACRRGVECRQWLARMLIRVGADASGFDHRCT